MRAIFNTLCLILFSVLSLTAQLDADKLDIYLETLYENDKFIGSVAIRDGGEIVYERAFGSFKPNETGGYPVNTETIYRVGSITKVFTATMIMQLIEEGKLSLDTYLSEYFPNVCNADKISIDHLLGHQSGIFNFTNDPMFVSYMIKGKNKAEMIEMIENLNCTFEPGAQAAYSNTNYVLLGYIIEILDEQTYAASLDERIISRLDLDRTYYGGPINRAKNEVSSFRRIGEKWENAGASDMFVPGGAGAIASTPADLTKFLQELMEGGLIGDDSRALMTEMRMGMGRGMFQYPFFDRVAYGHNGGIDAFLSTAAYFPKERIGIAVTSNGLNYDLNNLSIGILSCVFNEAFEIPDFESKALNEAEIDSYSGNYTSEALPLEISVFGSDDGVLKAQAAGQAAFPLDPAGEHTFEYEPAGIKMAFQTDASGKVTGFTLYQGGQEYPYTRK